MNMRWLGGKVTVLRKGEGAHRERWMARGCYKDSPSRTVARVIPLGRNSRPRGPLPERRALGLLTRSHCPPGLFALLFHLLPLSHSHWRAFELPHSA